MLERKIYSEMLKWKTSSNGKTALVIEGARRVGKSTIVKFFAQNEYEDYLVLDFAIESNDVKKLFIDDLHNLNAFFRNLLLLKNKSLPIKKSVIIFDEIELYPQARQAIKYLVQDGRYDYIETGSLISIKQNVKDILIPSEEYRLKMFPLDFEEFLWASGDKISVPAIFDSFNNRTPLGSAIHRKIMQNYRTYLAVGGMPSVVNAFVEGKTYSEIDLLKRSILELYEDDLRKYDKNNRYKASVIFKTIPEQLSNHNSHYKLSGINKNARFQNYADDFDFVNESMMANLCVNVTSPEIVLDLFADRSNFKLYMGDTGLLVTQIMKNSKTVNNDIYKSLIFDKLSINQGMILENAIAQMLKTKGYELFFHEFNYKDSHNEKENKYEIDFLIVKNKKLCPIEVKSSSYVNHKSFDMFSNKYKMKNGEKYIIYSKDYAYKDGINYIPFYMTICL